MVRWLGLLLALGAPLGQAAADEGESSLSGELSFAAFSVPDHQPAGAQVGVAYGRGVTSAVWLRAAVAGSFYLDDGDKAGAGVATLGLSYALDILKYVPYVDLGVGAYLVGGDAIDPAVHPVLELGLGLDVLRGRSRSYGGFVRLASFLGEASFLGVGLRATYRWGFF